MVQDQVSKKMVAKDPKMGWLFPLHINPITNTQFPSSFFACDAVRIDNQGWHRHLGHPNSNSHVIRTLFNSGLIGNTESYFINDISLTVSVASLVKVKFWHFQLIHLGDHVVLILFIVI
jgi:hypothetical protein